MHVDDPKAIPTPGTTVTVVDDKTRQAPIDVPSIMRAGGFKEGVDAERGRIVRWLRSDDVRQSRSADWLADAIERGEHNGG